MAHLLLNARHFNSTYLRNAFRTALLNEMESRIGPSFKRVKSRCYKEHKDRFYVYARPNKCDLKTVVKYIGRYLRRPVIASSRIDNYDGDFVTFHCSRHEESFNHKRVSLEELYEKAMSRSRGRRSSA